MSATALIVAARTEEGSVVGLFLVSADAQGLSRQAMHTLDSRDYARVTLSSVSVSSEAYLGAMPAGELYEAVLNRAAAGIAMEMLGVGCYSFEMTLDYLKTRKQFGKVIGSFQALGTVLPSSTQPKKWRVPARKPV